MAFRQDLLQVGQGWEGWARQAAWPAAHRLDAAHLFCLASQSAPVGTVLHDVADQGMPTRDIAELIGRHLDMPRQSMLYQDGAAHFGVMAGFFRRRLPASSTVTRELLG